jgi:cob(I)alamin adenosyltransferase
MKIYTKTGDAGSTSLACGKRVAKNHPRVEAYGAVDELMAHLGVVRTLILAEGKKGDTDGCTMKEQVVKSAGCNMESIDGCKEEKVIWEASKELLRVQEVLVRVAGVLATEDALKFSLVQDGFMGLIEHSIELLERSIDQMQEKLAPLKGFVLPGPPLSAAHCHIARTVCRRAERMVVALGTTEETTITNTPFQQIVAYLNRLSDYLFVLSRTIIFF